MEAKNVEKKTKNKKIIFIIIPIIIIISICFLFWKIYSDKTYKVEEVKEFSYFKLYENEKYGVIDAKRKCTDRT